MTPQDFVQVRKNLGMSQQALAEALGISKSSVELYERGTRRDDNRPVEIPKAIRLAMAALVAGLKPLGEEG